MIIRLVKKLLSVVNNRSKKIFLCAQSFLIEICTEKRWLLDYIPSSKEGRQSLMLVRLDVIGDFILWLDSAKAYRLIYPNKRIVLYANSSWAELAKQFNYWDEVVSIDMIRLRADELYRIKTFFKIRRCGFSVAVQPTYSREYIGDMLTRASGASVRVGYDSDLSNIQPEQKKISDRWYTEMIRGSAAPTMELIRNAEFVRQLGDTSFVSGVPEIAPLLDLPENLQFDLPYIVIFPGASWEPKMWPAEKFAELIKNLKAEYEFDILLCGGGDEYGLCQKIISDSKIDAHNLAGVTKLQELVEVIRNASLVVANDTSAIHIAAATQTNSVCVLGGGHFGRFLPYKVESSNNSKTPNIQIHKMDCYGCNWDCCYTKSPVETVPCVANISVAQVYSECLMKLARTTNISNEKILVRKF
jgi:ADP-heptose:LPS heptosyltransferase